MASTAFIQVSDLHKSYRDGEGNILQILRGASLSVAKGDTVAITGASGAGKSTFLYLLGSLDRPDRGTIRIEGAEISTLNGEQSARFRNDTIGFVFQFHHLLNDFTALENVMMPMWIRAGRTLPFQREATALLDEVGIADRATHKPAQLSGGEQQRLALARALANGPTVLLADEPTGNLDEDTSATVCDLMLRLNREHRLTLILVTHNLHIAGRMNRRYVLEHGLLNPAHSSGPNG
ncbi:MAG: ABC transporter ATP-binding protein [SAR324 cluster bacterium]|nr:ABC transporter ATP-binding protein [SAR324 cluster bacterium]